MKYFTRHTTSFTILAMAVFTLFAYSFSSATWNPPPANPPNGNVLPPVNVSTAVQVKAGNLGVNVLSTAANTGAVWSNRYCDANGENCFTYDDVTGGGGGSGGAAFYRCSNADTADPNNIPCHTAAFSTDMNKRYRAMSCHYPGDATYVTHGDHIKYFGAPYNQWYWFRNSSWYSCADESLLVIDTAATGSAGGSSGGNNTSSSDPSGAPLPTELNTDLLYICPNIDKGDSSGLLQGSCGSSCVGQMGIASSCSDYEQYRSSSQDRRCRVRATYQCTKVSEADWSAPYYEIAPIREWRIGVWGGCTGSFCTWGVQTRTVQCVDGGDNVRPDSECPQPKPSTTQSCYVDDNSCYSSSDD